MINPKEFTQRDAINSLTGIKSSLGNLRKVVSLTYLLYLANKKKSSIVYAESIDGKIVLKQEYKSFIQQHLNNSEVIEEIDDNPLLTSQIESLYVGLTLMFAFGRISFENTSLSMTKERTGGIRYPKKIDFASNIMTLDLILNDDSEESVKATLLAWLQDKQLDNNIEQRIIIFLNICIENNLFKLRHGEDDLYFQTEGIYKSLITGDEVSLESDEIVGPTRILNSMLRENLIPWLNFKKSLVTINADNDFNVQDYSDIISTSLSIRDIKVDNNVENAPKEEGTDNDDKNLSLQQIYYGAPGTGKSHKTDEVVSKYPETVRTTFHPDSDYSTFVGTYKPTMTKVRKAVVIGQDEKEVKPLDCNSEWEEKITYKFVKQAFLKAYVRAWKLFKETCVEGGELAPQFLVIEEINRGNCAQIFGDLFQLLDRKQNFSEYPVETDADICKALLEEDTKDNPSFGAEGLQLTEEQKAYINNVYDGKSVAEKICKGEVLVLPPNFYIWATMNTSDQSLFPIDSAFKRRWEWKYVRINEGKGKDKQPLNFRIQFTTLEGEKVDESWWDFIQKINEKIEVATKSEDKKLGYFFCRPDKKANETDKDNTVISAETFVGKVVFYLWQDVFKDYGFKSDIFKKDGNARLAFHDFYPHNIEPDEEKNPEGIDLKLVKRFIDKVMDRKPIETQIEAPAAAPTTE